LSNFRPLSQYYKGYSHTERIAKESAARQLISAAIQKIVTLNTTLQTAAESKNIVVRYLAIAAQKALNVAMAAASGR